MSLKFDAKNSTVAKVLFGDEKFRIPRYQRPYAWSEDQVSEFWNDLITSEEPYFIGSFIFNYEAFTKEETIDVIDGQQRLLTVTIFMAVLRDIVDKINKTFSDVIQTRDIIFVDRDGEFSSYRIEVGDSTREFFNNYIQKNDKDISEVKTNSVEEKRVKNNYLFFKDKIENELSKYNRILCKTQKKRRK